MNSPLNPMNSLRIHSLSRASSNSKRQTYRHVYGKTTKRGKNYLVRQKLVYFAKMKLTETKCGVNVLLLERKWPKIVIEFTNWMDGGELEGKLDSN